jgi:hypothetical protein
MPHLAETLALSMRHLETADRLIAGQTALVLRLTEDKSNVLQEATRLLSVFESVREQMAIHHRSLLAETERRGRQQCH